jgi:hypothetical protein
VDNVVDHAADNGNTSATRATMPAQQGWQCQHNKENDASTKRAMKQAQLMMPQNDKSRCQCNKGDNADEVVDAAMECGYNYLRLLRYAN